MAAMRVDGDDTTTELEALERRRLAAFVAADHEALASLHADDYELIPPGGGAIGKEDYLGMIASGEFRYLVFEPASAVRIRRSGDTAILRYRVRIEARWDGGNDAGGFWHTDYDERRNGRWQAVWSQATRIPPNEPS